MAKKRASKKNDQPMSELVLQFKAARRAATPLISIATSDDAATIRSICSHISDEVPKLQWDICNGLSGINDVGNQQIESTEQLHDVDSEVSLVKSALYMKERTIVFVHMSNRFLAGEEIETKMFIQGIWNLRDMFKSDKRTFVLLGPQVMLPPELQNDVVPLEEALPSKIRLEVIVRKQYENAGLDVEEDKIERAVEAVVGLAAFQAEQVTAMSMTKDGLDIDSLWERKRKQIEQTPGLSINREGFKFEDIGGLDSAKRFLTRYFEGKRRPSCIVFVDEIEKAMAGEGDMSGISQDQLGQTLQYMQNSQATGIMFVGHPGSGKSALAKATGNEFGVPTIEFDFGGMKGGIVGESETNMRNALRVVDSVSGGNPLFIATSNGIENLKSELKSRFKLGTYMFDLPSKDEQSPIWEIHIKQRGLDAQPFPPSDGWTGREIEQCCEFADCMGITLVEAAEYIVPICIADARKVEGLRKQGDGRWQDATNGGIYKRPTAPVSSVAKEPSSRTVDLDDQE